MRLPDLPLLPISTFMAPELDETMGAKPESIRPSSLIMEVDGARTARPVWIELDPVQREGDPVAAASGELGIVRSAAGPAQLLGISLQPDAGQGQKIKDGLASLQGVLAEVAVQVLPEEAAPRSETPIPVNVEVQVVSRPALDCLQAGPLNLDEKAPGCGLETVVGQPLVDLVRTDQHQGADHAHGH